MNRGKNKRIKLVTIRSERDLIKHFGLPTPSVAEMEKAVRAASRRCAREASRRLKGPRTLWQRHAHVLDAAASRLSGDELQQALDIICDLFATRGRNGVRLDHPDPNSWHNPKAALTACWFLQKHGLVQFVEDRGVWEFCGRAK